MTFQLEYFVKMCVLLECLNRVLYHIVWATNFSISEHTHQVPLSSDMRGSTVLIVTKNLTKTLLTR